MNLSFLFILLNFFEIFIQTIQSPFPQLAGFLDPVRDFLQPVQFGFAVSFTALLMDHHQTTFLEDLYVPRYRRSADTKFLGYTVEGESLGSQQTQNGSAVGIGNCLKNVSSHNEYVTIQLRNISRL